MGGGERGKENHKLEEEKGAKRIISSRLQKNYTYFKTHYHMVCFGHVVQAWNRV
jgi:hypothetical protein